MARMAHAATQTDHTDGRAQASFRIWLQTAPHSAQPGGVAGVADRGYQREAMPSRCTPASLDRENADNAFEVIHECLRDARHRSRFQLLGAVPREPDDSAGRVTGSSARRFGRWKGRCGNPSKGFVNRGALPLANRAREALRYGASRSSAQRHPASRVRHPGTFALVCDAKLANSLRVVLIHHSAAASGRPAEDFLLDFAIDLRLRSQSRGL